MSQTPIPANPPDGRNATSLRTLHLDRRKRYSHPEMPLSNHILA